MTPIRATSAPPNKRLQLPANAVSKGSGKPLLGKVIDQRQLDDAQIWLTPKERRKLEAKADAVQTDAIELRDEGNPGGVAAGE
jgi:hypothetical protein